MGANVAGCSIKTKGLKTFFSIGCIASTVRNEAHAIQQQSLAGFKPKNHGFFDFKQKPDPVGGDHVLVEWWCWTEPGAAGSGRYDVLTPEEAEEKS